MSNIISLTKGELKHFLSEDMLDFIIFQIPTKQKQDVITRLKARACISIFSQETLPLFCGPDELIFRLVQKCRHLLSM